MLTKQFKVTIATILAVSGISAFGVSQLALNQRVNNLERQDKTTVVSIAPSPTLAVTPIASPTANLKPKVVVPTHGVSPVVVTVTPPIR